MFNGQNGRASHSQGGINSHKTLYMSHNDRMQEIGKAYNYNGQESLSAANIKIQSSKKGGQVSQSLTRGQIREATKRSATGGTGNAMTPSQHQTIQHIASLANSGAQMIPMVNQSGKQMRTIQATSSEKPHGGTGKLVSKSKTRLPNHKALP